MTKNILASLMILTSVFAASIAAQAADIPIHDGSLANVTGVRLVVNSKTGEQQVLATIKYKGACAAPTAFVVATPDGVQYMILESRERVSGAHCGAISIQSQEVLVKTFAGPAQAISVNGVPSDPSAN